MIKFIKKDIFLIALSRLINNLGNFVFPLLSFILLQIAGISQEHLGIAIMLITLSKIPGSYIGGIIADRMPLKHVIAYSNLLMGIILIGIPISSTYSLFIGLFFVRFFSGFYVPATNKLLISKTNDKNNSEAFALVHWCTNVGSALSLGVAGFIFSYSPKLLFILDGITRIVAGTVIFFIQDMAFKDERKSTRIKIKFIDLVKKYPKIIYLFMMILIFAYVYSQYSYALPLKLEIDFTSQATKIYSILLSTNCMAVIIFTPFINKLSKKFSVFHNITISFIFIGMGMGGYFWSKGILLMLLTTLIWTIGEILYGIYSPILISELVRKEHLGITLGINEVLYNIMSSFSPFINGIVITYIGLKSSWIILILLAITGSILSLKLKKNI